MQRFNRSVVTASTVEKFRAALADFEVMIVTVLDAMLDRYDRTPDYPFIDTKLSILSGQDFAEPPEVGKDFKSRRAIYAWIQGRGLEALVGHARWLERCAVLTDDEKATRAERLRKMIYEVFERMETIRTRNGGRLFFTMTPEGEPFDVDADGRRRVVSLRDTPHNFSDLFYAKGMLSAAHFFGMGCRVQRAKEYFRRILDDILSERFTSDQVPLNPSNPKPTTAGQFSHGPRMIAVGGCALFAGLLDEDEWFEAGVALVRELMGKHLNLGQFKGLRKGDYFERRDAEGNPCVEDGKVRSDPGHALEFVGLTAKLLLLLKDRPTVTDEQQALLRECIAVLPEVFLRNFANGWYAKTGGIIKNFDLVARAPISTEMPWWPLPETMRAAAELLVLCPAATRSDAIVDALVKCANTFITRFVNVDVHLMAFQTLSASGHAIDAIPATPDADPGYHTGLSLIDMLDCLAKV